MNSEYVFFRLLLILGSLSNKNTVADFGKCALMRRVTAPVPGPSSAMVLTSSHRTDWTIFLAKYLELGGCLTVWGFSEILAGKEVVRMFSSRYPPLSMLLMFHWMLEGKLSWNINTLRVCFSVKVP